MQSCCGCWQLFARIFGNGFNGSGTYKSTPLNASEQNFPFSFPSTKYHQVLETLEKLRIFWKLRQPSQIHIWCRPPQQITTTIFTILVLLHTHPSPHFEHVAIIINKEGRRRFEWPVGHSGQSSELPVTGNVPKWKGI